MASLSTHISTLTTDWRLQSVVSKACRQGGQLAYAGCIRPLAGPRPRLAAARTILAGALRIHTYTHGFDARYVCVHLAMCADQVLRVAQCAVASDGARTVQLWCTIGTQHMQKEPACAHHLPQQNQGREQLLCRAPRCRQASLSTNTLQPTSNTELWTSDPCLTCVSQRHTRQVTEDMQHRDACSHASMHPVMCAVTAHQSAPAMCLLAPVARGFVMVVHPSLRCMSDPQPATCHGSSPRQPLLQETLAGEVPDHKRLSHLGSQGSSCRLPPSHMTSSMPGLSAPTMVQSCFGAAKGCATVTPRYNPATVFCGPTENFAAVLHLG